MMVNGKKREYVTVMSAIIADVIMMQDIEELLECKI